MTTAAQVNAEWARVRAERLAEYERWSSAWESEQKAKRPGEFVRFCAQAGIAMDELTAASLLAEGKLSGSVMDAFSSFRLHDGLMSPIVALGRQNEKTRWLVGAPESSPGRQDWARFLLEAGSSPRSPATLRTLGRARHAGVAFRGASRRVTLRRKSAPSGGQHD